MDTLILTTTAAVVGQTARSAQSVSEQLQNFLLHAGSQPDTTRSLQSEVKSFGDACEALQSLLNGIAGAKTLPVGAEDERFYIKAQQAMSEYGTTVHELGQHVRTAESRKSGFLRKASIKTEDVVRARQRIDSHFLSAQLMLGICNLRLAVRSFEVFHLSTLKNRIEELQREQSKLQATSRVNSPHLGQDHKLFAATAELIAEADRALTFATTIYENTISTRSATRLSRSSVVPNLAREDSDTVPLSAVQPARRTDTNSVYQGSMTTASMTSFQVAPKLPVVVTSPILWTESNENGQASHSTQTSVPAQSSKDDSVSQWIHGLSELDRRQRSSIVPSTISRPSTLDRSSSTAASEVRSSQSIGERLISVGTAPTEPSISPLSHSSKELPRGDVGRQTSGSVAVIDDSDDDDIGVELVENVLTMGKAALDKEDYGGAKRCLLEGLSLVHQLPLKLQAGACDMLELRYQLAMCALALDSQTAIEKALVEVLQQEPSTDAQREKLFHVSHILAQLYIRTARLTLARQTCNNALRGRRKLCGKQSDGYYASLALMARICELECVPLQSQGYTNMIPVEERQKHTYHHLSMEEYSQKEVVVLEDDRMSSQSSQAAMATSKSRASVSNAGFHIFVPPTSPISHSDPSTQIRDEAEPDRAGIPPRTGSIIVDRTRSFVAAAESNSVQQPAVHSTAQTVVQSGASVRSIRSSRSSITEHVPASAPPPTSPSVVLARSYVPLATPDNDYLGYCKGAWLLQTGDRKAMKKTKEFNYGRSSNPVYSLRCSASKCEFATEIELSVIGTWTKVWRTKEKIGIAYRWTFLAKSHVRQSTKANAHQTMYRCMFCTSLGLHTPVIQGTDLYFDHIAQEHRGSELSQVVLYQTRCINDRVCASDNDEFDINLYPRT